MDGFNRLADSCSDVAIGSFKRTRPSGGLIELAGKPRAIAAERMDLAHQRCPLAIGLQTPLGGGLKRIERKRKPPRRSFKQIGVAHLAIRPRPWCHTGYENCATPIIYRQKLTSYGGKASTACQPPVHDLGREPSRN
jgi:hypothetical protein